MANSQQEQYPDLDPYANGLGGSATDMKNSAIKNAQSAMNSISNSQTVQSIANGPVADKARAEADTTKNEFNSLAASRQTPNAQTANGQQLTHYHSFFYNLLSWEHPRATAISFASTVALIFVSRYVPLARYALKATYIILGFTAAAEIAGKLVLGEGLSSKMRPRKYYTVSRETLESVLGDLEELINFFVIEFQRIVFAENVYATVGAFLSAFLSYFLVKVMPTWGLALFFTTVVYFTPLAYISNKELIDHHLNNAQNVISEQTSQIRGIAAQHTNKAYEMSQSALKDYGAKAQEMIGQGKKAAVDNNVVSQSTADKVAPQSGVSSDAFPSAPQAEPKLAQTSNAEPLAA